MENIGVYDTGRRNFVWALMGTNTTGKTPSAIKLAKNWKRPRPFSKVIVFDPREDFTKARIVDVLIEQKNENWAENLLKKRNGEYIYKNSLLILDDYKMLCKNNSTDPYFLDLLSLRVKLNMDVIIICHAPMLILERLSYYITDYSIFYNEASTASFQKKINKYSLCQEAAVMINEYVTKHGRGIYPKFPHIHINTEKGELDCVNMDGDKVKQLTCVKM